MALHLPKEFETSVSGNDRLIIISQIDEYGQEVVIYLTIHQFETIFNFSKSILNEAMEAE